MRNSTCWHDGCNTPSRKWGMCEHHYSKWIVTYPPKKTRINKPDAERFAFYLLKSGDNQCWIWTGALDSNGYGVFNARNTAGFSGQKSHRYSYLLAHGKLPEDLELDHLCRVRPCCNPAHLEAVTQKINTMRGVGFGPVNAEKTHCPQGHEYTEENTYTSEKGWRRCRICLGQSTEKWISKTNYNERKKEERKENKKIRTHCKNNHPLSGNNLIEEKNKNGEVIARRCRTCVNAKARSNHEKRRAQHTDARRSDETCRNGHPRTEENTMMVSGKRRCRTCHNERSRDSYQRMKNA